MPRHKQNQFALTVVSYAGVLYAAVAVFAVTLFGATAIGDAPAAYTYPLHHWVIAAGAAAVVVGLLLSAVEVLLADARGRRDRL